MDGREASRLVDGDLSRDEPELSIVSSDTLSFETSNNHEVSVPVSAVGCSYSENLALTPLDHNANFDPEVLSEIAGFVPQGVLLEKKILPLENPKEMFARWKIDNLDLKTVVNDALLSGRLPLAVLQLHLHRSRDLVSDKEPYDTFMEIRNIGRAIAYDLFLKVTYF